MIPIKLTLRNFMSYGDPAVTIPFEELHVACLSGDNGNGKSAVLDGITWAVWGKTRASAVKSVSEDDLIRLGSDEVEVRFEFELNEQRYRVIKKRKRGKSSGSEWQLAQQDASGGWAAIGGNSQRETGKQIVQLLSMEYETFLNSAYLQQGRADEFTRQTPDNRKRILGEILGLDRFDRLEAKARERYRECKESAEELEREIRLLDAELDRLPGYTAQLEQTQTAISEMSARVAEQEKLTAGLRDRRSKLDAVAEQLAQGEAQHQRLLADMALREQERCAQVDKLEQLRKVLEQKEAILADYAGLQRATKRREQLEPQIEEFNRKNADLQNVRGAIDVVGQKLRGEIKVVEAEVAHAEQRCRERARLAAQVKTLTEELQQEPELDALLAAAQSESQELQQAFAELSAENRELTAALNDLNEVIELLSRPQAACPVCESDLSGQKRAKVLARQEAKRDTLLQRQKEIQQEGRAKKQALTVAQQQVEVLTRQRDERTARSHRLADLQAQLTEIAGAEADLDRLHKTAEQLRLQLDRGEYAAPQRLQLQRLEQDLKTLGLAKAEYETVKQQMQRLEGTHRRYQELEHANSHWERECEEKERLDRVISSLLKARAEAESRLETLRGKLAKHEEIVQATAAAESELNRLQTDLNALRVTEGSLQRYIAECDRAKSERKSRMEQHSKTDEERKVFHALASAFGKRGVQALIIENAIPELEEEANNLLARMTDNAMQVHFETTRTAKGTGNEIETLDIRITDDAGARPYELFSGGEAFRINFAIRIALSRLLARRAGAKLQTLIMDEGFGSQDGKGREKLVEVIESIKDDFEKILVITHVEELKDAFAQRIEITKDTSGSHVHLL